METSLYNYSLSESSPRLFPIHTFVSNCVLAGGNQIIKDIQKNPLSIWGNASPVEILTKEGLPMPEKVNLEWISIIESKIYRFSGNVDREKGELIWKKYSVNKLSSFRYFVIGMAPFGGVAFWFRGYIHSVLLGWMKADEVDLSDSPGRLTEVSSQCDNYLNNDSIVQGYLSVHGLPDPHLFDRMMQQFNYRFQPVLKKWDKDAQAWVNYGEEEKQPELDFVEVKRHDGTFDRLRDGSLLSYHQAGKPSRVCVGWHEGKREYSVYFFFSHDELVPLFRACYGAHPETKVDFLLQIDPESDKYEPALFRFGMKEPMRVGPEACQVLVFRNKFECYRSSNYTQPRGAWR